MALSLSLLAINSWIRREDHGMPGDVSSLDPVSRAGQSAQERAPARLDQATKGDLLARNRIPKLERAISQQILEPLLWLKHYCVGDCCLAF